jgi:short-subunit dehydrogenase involved in D-alanine esterification of teichoic acids
MVRTRPKCFCGFDSKPFTVLVTGIFVNGLGFETARVLAKHANIVIITGYNSER